MDGAPAPGPDGTVGEGSRAGIRLSDSAGCSEAGVTGLAQGAESITTRSPPTPSSTSPGRVVDDGDEREGAPPLVPDAVATRPAYLMAAAIDSASESTTGEPRPLVASQPVPAVKPPSPKSPFWPWVMSWKAVGVVRATW